MEIVLGVANRNGLPFRGLDANRPRLLLFMMWGPSKVSRYESGKVRGCTLTSTTLFVIVQCLTVTKSSKIDLSEFEHQVKVLGD